MKKISLILCLLLSYKIAYGNGETYTPNMNLTVPAVGTTIGPQWASDINTSLGVIDAHDHTPGHGVLITPQALNISSNLTFQGNSLTLAKSVNFTSQSSPVSNGSIYENGVDLYYVDGNGNNVRLTQSGSIVGTSGSISGLTSPASASYSSISDTFVWQSGTNIAANLDAGCLLQRDLNSASNAITLCPPSSLAANYSLTWPATLPSVQSFATIDSSGNIGDAWAPDNSTIVVSGNTVEVPAGGITTNQIASGTIVGSNVSSSINLPGTPSVGGKNIVVSASNLSSPMKTYRGSVGALGNIAFGEGFTSVLSGTAEYTITYTTPFSAPPVVIATASFVNTSETVVIFTSDPNGFTALTFNSSGSALAVQFNFIAIGPS